MKQTSFAQWRAEMGITQTQAADLLGVAPRTIQHWEYGVTAAGDPSVPPKGVRIAMAVLVKKPKTEPWPE